MNDGIIIVQIEPNNSIEILALSENSDEAIRQIAGIMEYPADDPLSTGNLGPLYSRSELIPTGTFHTGKLKLYNAGRVNALRPDDATLIWHDSAHAAQQGMPINFMASNVQRHERGQSIYGRAVLSGFDLETATIRSVPLRTLEHDLSMEAFRGASGYVRAWREARGL